MQERNCAYCGSLIDPVNFCPMCAGRAEYNPLQLMKVFCPFHDRARRGNRVRYCNQKCRRLYWQARRRERPSARHGRCRHTAPLPL